LPLKDDLIVPLNMAAGASLDGDQSVIHEFLGVLVWVAAAIESRLGITGIGELVLGMTCIPLN
jgi:hypothetical protein